MTLSSGDFLLPLKLTDDIIVDKFSKPESLGDRFVLARTFDGITPVKITKMDTLEDRGLAARLTDDIVLVKLEDVVYSIYNYGKNTYGVLGTGNTASHWEAEGLVVSDVSAYSFTNRHAVFLKKDGSVWACGTTIGATVTELTDIPDATMIAVHGDELYFVDDSDNLKWCPLDSLTSQTTITGGAPDRFINHNSDYLYALYGATTKAINEGVVKSVDVSGVIDACDYIFLTSEGKIYAYGVSGKGVVSIAYVYGYDGPPDASEYEYNAVTDYGSLEDPWEIEVFADIQSIAAGNIFCFVDDDNHVIKSKSGLFPHCYHGAITASDIVGFPDLYYEVTRMPNGHVVSDSNSVDGYLIKPTRNITSAKDIFTSTENVYITTAGYVEETPKLYAYWKAYYNIDSSSTVLSCEGGGYEETYDEWTLIKYHKIISTLQRYTGTGLDDMVFLQYKEMYFDYDVRIKITAIDQGSPLRDQFQYSSDGGSSWSSDVDITGELQNITTPTASIPIKFNSTTGHTIGDYWQLPEKPSIPSVPTQQYWHWSASYDCWAGSWIVELTHTDCSGPVTGWSTLATKGLSTCTTTSATEPSPPSSPGGCLYLWWAGYDCDFGWTVFDGFDEWWPEELEPEAFMNSLTHTGTTDWFEPATDPYGYPNDMHYHYKITDSTVPPSAPSFTLQCYQYWYAEYWDGEWWIMWDHQDVLGPAYDWRCYSGCSWCECVTETMDEPDPPTCTP